MTSPQTEPAAADGAPSPSEPAAGDILYLNRRDVRAAMGASIRGYVEALRGALALHAEGRTAQPLKPYLKWRENGHIADRIIAMPGYVGGEQAMAGIKWIGSKHDNPSARGIERASAVIVLNDPDTHFPVAILEGGEISGMRTAGVTVLATEFLAREGFSRVALVGCGFIGRLHALGLLESFDSITDLFLNDRNEGAAQRLAAALARSSCPARSPTRRTSAPSGSNPGRSSRTSRSWTSSPTRSCRSTSSSSTTGTSATARGRRSTSSCSTGSSRARTCTRSWATSCAARGRAARRRTSGSCSTRWAWRSRTSHARRPSTARRASRGPAHG